MIENRDPNHPECRCYDCERSAEACARLTLAACERFELGKLDRDHGIATFRIEAYGIGIIRCFVAVPVEAARGVRA